MAMQTKPPWESNEPCVVESKLALRQRMPRPLSEEIDGLILAFADRAVCLREVLLVLHARAYTLLLILLALPFCTPVPLPGVSTPFGLVIAFIGLRLFLGQKPWLPQRLLDKELPARFFARLLAGANRIIRLLEYFLRPRWKWLARHRFLQRVYGAVIGISGLLLLLPLPIPFSNFFPALTIVLFAAAILERDGYFVMAGFAAFSISLLYFAALFWGGAEIAAWLEDWFGGIFDPNYEQPII
jgi:hypothetical protein